MACWRWILGAALVFALGILFAWFKRPVTGLRDQIELAEFHLETDKTMAPEPGVGLYTISEKDAEKLRQWLSQTGFAMNPSRTRNLGTSYSREGQSPFLSRRLQSVYVYDQPNSATHTVRVILRPDH